MITKADASDQASLETATDLANKFQSLVRFCPDQLDLSRVAVIYLHGFASGIRFDQGTAILKINLEKSKAIEVALPDLNVPTFEKMTL